VRKEGEFNGLIGRGEITIEHHRAGLRRGAHVASLLFQFPDGSLLCCLAGIYEAGGYFNDDFVDGRAELFLQEYLGAWPGVVLGGSNRRRCGCSRYVRACCFFQDCYYSDAIYVRAFWTCAPFGMFPCSCLTVGVLVG
jgi:hypothetical protein